MMLLRHIDIKQMHFVTFSLYNAISDQLGRVGETWNADKLRKEAAAHLRKHQNDFIHFLNDEYASDNGFEKYCTELESTAAWGGQIEVISNPFMKIDYSP